MGRERRGGREGKSRKGMEKGGRANLLFYHVNQGRGVKGDGEEKGGKSVRERKSVIGGEKREEKEGHSANSPRKTNKMHRSER